MLQKGSDKMIHFKEEIAKQISLAIGKEKEEILTMIEVPKEQKQGDYAFPCFRLAGEFKKAPQMIAKEIHEKLELKEDLIEKAEVIGGYLNFFVGKEALAKTVIEEMKMKEEEYGKSKIGEGKTVIVEYSSPNIAKPFHIGHLRNTLIGNALYHTYQYLGYHTIRNQSSWRLWYTIRKDDRRI